MKRELNFKSLLILLLMIEAFSSCKKDEVKKSSNEGIPTIMYVNQIHAPMEISINGKLDTLDYNEKINITGAPGTQIIASARSLPYKRASSVTGTFSYPEEMVGESINMDLSGTIPRSNTEVTPIYIPEGYYLLSVKNNTSEELLKSITINYGIKGSSSFNLMPDSYRYNRDYSPIGFFKVISPVAVIAFHSKSGESWVYRDVKIINGSTLELDCN